MTEPLDISTAPMDGTPLLLWCPLETGQRWVVGEYAPLVKRWARSLPDGAELGGGDDWLWPAAWRSLPAAPSERWLHFARLTQASVATGQILDHIADHYDFRRGDGEPDAAFRTVLEGLIQGHIREYG